MQWCCILWGVTAETARIAVYVLQFSECGPHEGSFVAVLVMSDSAAVFGCCLKAVVGWGGAGSQSACLVQTSAMFLNCRPEI